MRNIFIALALPTAFAFPAQADDWPKYAEQRSILVEQMRGASGDQVADVLECVARSEKNLRRLGGEFSSLASACIVVLMDGDSRDAPTAKEVGAKLDSTFNVCAMVLGK